MSLQSMATHEQDVMIVAWARSPVAAIGGALSTLALHELAAPVAQAVLARSGLAPHDKQSIDTVVLGNALGAGGNPARMLALATGLAERCAAHSVDTQCCSGLDAVALAAGLLQSGQAELVLAGGAEAWSRAPIRQTRPQSPQELPQTYERPPFAPRPEQDPDLLQAAADFALRHHYPRQAQEAWAQRSHQLALQTGHADIVPMQGLTHDAYPRALRSERMARMPLVASASAQLAQELAASVTDPENTGQQSMTAALALAAHGLSAPTISAKADGAALLLLASRAACKRYGLRPLARWICSASVGVAPHMPLLAAADAATLALQRASARLGQPLHATQLTAVELHDAFAVQALDFCARLGLAPEQLNRSGGGLARGHPIAASGAIALVRLLQQLHEARAIATHSAVDAPVSELGLAAIAGAGGIGAACVVEALEV